MRTKPVAPVKVSIAKPISGEHYVPKVWLIDREGTYIAECVGGNDWARSNAHLIRRLLNKHLRDPKNEAPELRKVPPGIPDVSRARPTQVRERKTQ
jgi:hypothetical protein